MSSSSPSEFTASTRFEIRRQVGIGGMGVVYEAYDRHREEVVAIKKIRHLNSEGIYRLKKEFRALADLTHPNLVALYELFSGEDGYFFSMEYVAGVDFLTYVRGTTDRARDIGTHKSESMSTVEGDQPPPPQGGMQDVLPDELAWYWPLMTCIGETWMESNYSTICFVLPISQRCS